MPPWPLTRRLACCMLPQSTLDVDLTSVLHGIRDASILMSSALKRPGAIVSIASAVGGRWRSGSGQREPGSCLHTGCDLPLSPPGRPPECPEGIWQLLAQGERRKRHSVSTDSPFL